MTVVPDRIDLLTEEEMGSYSEFRVLSQVLDRIFQFTKIGDMVRNLEEAGVSTRGLGAYSTPLAARGWLTSRMAAVHRQLWESVLRRAHLLAKALGKQLEMEAMCVCLPLGPVEFEFRMKFV